MAQKTYSIDSDIKDLINWTKEIPETLFNENLLETVARKFRDRAKQKLQLSGALKSDITKYVNAITMERIDDNTYRIYAGRNGSEQLQDDMYYLEFGTGIKGQERPHPEASQSGWQYNRNKHSSDIGWTFRRTNEYATGNADAFIAKDDIVHYYKNNLSAGKAKGGDSSNPRIFAVKADSEKSIQTFGVIAVRYFYDTMQDFNQILTEAIKETEGK